MDELLLSAEQIDRLEASMRQVIRDECALLQQHVRLHLMTSLNTVFRDIEWLKGELGVIGRRARDDNAVINMKLRGLKSEVEGLYEGIDNLVGLLPKSEEE